MKKTFIVILTLFSVVFMSACSNIKVVSDKDDSVDFTQFKTFEYYGWAKDSDKLLNPFDKERIEQAFGKELAARGLTRVEKGSGGDLIITLYVVTEQKKRITATTTGMGGGYYGYGYRYRGYGPSYGWAGGSARTVYNEQDYVVGTLIIAMYNAKEKKLIWESSGQATLKESTEGRKEQILEGVAAMMEAYPVPAPQ